MEINHLGNLRYFITGLTNDVSTLLSPARTVSLTVTMSATYAQLIEKHTTRLQNDSTSLAAQQILRNHMTALRAWMSFLGKSETSTIGQELTIEFSESVKRHVASLDLGQRSKSDRRSLLNAWRLTFDLMGAAADKPIRGRERARADLVPTNPSVFEVGLKAALRKAGLTPKAAARRARVSASALARWSRGALPNKRSQHTLSRLEEVLGLPNEHLADLLRQSLGSQLPAVRNEYRERLKARCATPYLLKLTSLRPDFLVQWQEMLRHKTASRNSGKRRLGAGRWTPSGDANSSGAIAGITVLNDVHYASAGVLWNHTAAFLGFLQLNPDSGGWGLEPEVAQSLAWLSVPEAVEDYLEFAAERAGGLRHTGQAVFCSALAALNHPTHGFLTQHKKNSFTLPPERTATRSWEEMCAETRSLVDDWRSTCTDVSRSPEQAIHTVLGQHNPLAPIFTAMTRLHKLAAAAPAGSQEEAVARRDELLLGMLISNPLRRKNLIDLTYFADNTGSLYQTTSGEWRLRLRTSTLKNGRKTGGERKGAYDVRVADWLHPLLTDYVKTFRPVLRGLELTDNLFLTVHGQPMKDMTHRVLTLTRTHIPGSGGFGPHAFRHIVATDWLRRNPNDFLTVAQLLNDTLEVVMRTYAHLKRDDALTRHSTQLSEFLPAHLRNRK